MKKGSNKIILIVILSFTLLNFIQANNSCIPDWDCTEWYPKECPREGFLTRNCEDKNNCPNSFIEEELYCTYKEKNKTNFYLLISAISISVILTTISIIYLLNKQNERPNI